MLTKIVVEERHLDGAKREQCNECLLAKAIDEHVVVGTEVRVQPMWFHSFVSFWHGGALHGDPADLPARAAQLARDFDAERPLHLPFEFELDIPDQLLIKED